MAKGDKIGMALCILKPLPCETEVVCGPIGNTSPILPPTVCTTCTHRCVC